MSDAYVKYGFDPGSIVCSVDWLQGVVPVRDVSQVLKVFEKYDFKRSYLSVRARGFLNYSVAFQYRLPDLEDALCLIAYNPVSGSGEYVNVRPRSNFDIITGLTEYQSNDFEGFEIDGQLVSGTAEENSNNPYVFIMLSGKACHFLSPIDFRKFCFDLAELGFKPSRFDLACDFFGLENSSIVNDVILDALSNPFMNQTGCSSSFKSGLSRTDKSGKFKVDLYTEYINYYPSGDHTHSISFGSHHKSSSGMIRFYDKYFEQHYINKNEVFCLDNYWWRLEFETHRHRSQVAFLCYLNSGSYVAFVESCNFFFRPVVLTSSNIYLCESPALWNFFLECMFEQNDYLVSFDPPIVEKISHYPSYLRNSIKAVGSYISLMAYAIYGSQDDLPKWASSFDLDDLISRFDEGMQRAYGDNVIYTDPDKVTEFYNLFKDWLLSLKLKNYFN